MQHFKITANKPLSKLAKGFGLYDDVSLIHYIQQTPYGRTSNRTDVSLVLLEDRGTCSSKHALIKAIATENNVENLDLVIGMYRMSETNTPKIGKVLSENGLSYIPEAHCYLKYNHQQIDITTNNSDFEIIKNAIIEEIPIEPTQIGIFKVEYHQAFLKNWLKENDLEFSFEEIWAIREQCIANLSS